MKLCYRNAAVILVFALAFAACSKDSDIKTATPAGISDAVPAMANGSLARMA